jgi:hypothetical protein
MAGEYVSATSALRKLRVFQEKDVETALEQNHADEAELTEAGHARVHPCSLLAPPWGGRSTPKPCVARLCLIGTIQMTWEADVLI